MQYEAHMNMRAIVFHRGKHLDSTDVYPATDTCPICQNSAPRNKVAALQVNPSIDLLKCNVCGGASASSMPRQHIMTQYYYKYYERQTGKPNVTIENAEKFGQWVAKSVNKLSSEHSRLLKILDFGGGDGSLAIAVANALRCPADITVVDASATTNDHHNDFIKIRFEPDLLIINETFDLIIASAVLEHIPNCGTVLKKLWDLVKHGGYIYARTPYVVPLIHIFPKMDFTYPVHLHDLGPGFWNKVIHTFGYHGEIIVSRPSKAETGYRNHLIRTILVNLLKAPARLEVLLRGLPQQLIWPYVGGWEIVLRKF